LFHDLDPVLFIGGNPPAERFRVWFLGAEASYNKLWHFSLYSYRGGRNYRKSILFKFSARVTISHKTVSHLAT